MTDQERGFLDAIIDEPDDDTHRLVFSDWLDDHGQPERAEFIRLQIEHAKLGYRNPRAVPLQRRIRDILVQHQTEWTREVHPAIDPSNAHFIRGFLEEWNGTIDEYTQIGDAIHERTPLLSFVEVGEPERIEIEELADCPFVAGLRNLYLTYCPVNDNDVAPLFSSPYLVNLRSLDLGETGVTGRTITALIESSFLPSLRSLNLEETGIGANSIVRLAKAPLLARLEELDLSRCAISSKGVRALAKSPHLGALTSLRLDGVGCTGEDVRALLEGASLEALDALALSNNPIGNVGVEAVAHASRRFDFGQLEFAHCELDARALELLLTAELTTVSNLGLGSNDFDDESLARFLTEAELPELEHLSLFSTGASTQTLQVLPKRFPDGIASLYLSANPLEDEAVARFVESGMLRNVTELWLGYGLTDISARALIDSPSLDNLVALSLHGNNFSDAMTGELRARFGIGVYL